MNYGERMGGMLLLSLFLKIEQLKSIIDMKTKYNSKGGHVYDLFKT